MQKRWSRAIDEIRREKFGDAEGLRREGRSGQRQFLIDGLRFLVGVGAAAFLLSLLRACF